MKRVKAWVLVAGIGIVALLWLTGCEVDVHIPNIRPVARFSVQGDGGFAPLTVYFDASASYDPDGSIKTYQWSFGDGATGSGKSLSHYYQRGGNYVVTLLVTDNYGMSSEFSYATVEVKNPPPVARFTLSLPRVNIGQTVYVDAVGSYDPAALKGIIPVPDPDEDEPKGKVVSYEWNFGDNTPIVSMPAATASHIYSNAGIYTLTLVVIDDYGARSEPYSQTVSVNYPPVAKIFYHQCPVPLSVKKVITLKSPYNVFKGILPEPSPDVCWELDGSSSYDRDGRIVEYEWMWGDTSISTDQVIQLSLSSGTAYTITLIVTDDNGATGYDSVTID